MQPALWPRLPREEAASFQQQTQLTGLALDSLWQAGLATLATVSEERERSGFSSG